MKCDMNFIYFICPETPQFAKYCEGFYNYLTYGYKIGHVTDMYHPTQKIKTEDREL